MSGRAPLFFILVCVLAGTLALESSSVSTARGQDAAKYLGPDKCKMCHSDQHKVWLEMKHSKAWSILKPEDIAGRKDIKDRVCVKCHSTGYDKPGGFVSLEETPKLVNVTCESCHGPGSIHMTFMLQSAMLDGDEKKEMEAKGKAALDRSFSCNECHNPHISHKKLYGEKEKEKE